MTDDTQPSDFNLLWSHLNRVTQNGTETSTLAEPIQYNYTEFADNNRCLEENLEFNGEMLDLNPQFLQSLMSNSADLPQSQNYNSPPNLQGMNVFPPEAPVVGDGANFQQGDAIPPPPFSPCGAASQQIPSNTDYPGEYNFQIYMGKHAQTVAKSANWTYSSNLNKLYADKDKSFPIQFKTEHQPREPCFIRATPVFKKPGHVQEVVKRCPNHTEGEGSEDPSAKHLLISKHRQAEYAQHPGTDRLSVVIPYEEPQVGTEYTTYLFIFKCTISCVGGMNRRPAMLIFTLENKNGITLGRRVIEVRPCACPGRDRKNDEAECGKEKRCTKEKGNKRTKVTAQSTTISQVGAKKRKLNTEDEVFTITVRGRENYEILKKVNDALEMMRNISPDLRKQSRGIHTHLKREPKTKKRKRFDPH